MYSINKLHIIGLSPSHPSKALLLFSILYDLLSLHLHIVRKLYFYFHIKNKSRTTHAGQQSLNVKNEKRVSYTSSNIQSSSQRINTTRDEVKFPLRLILIFTVRVTGQCSVCMQEFRFQIALAFTSLIREIVCTDECTVVDKIRLKQFVNYTI